MLACLARGRAANTCSVCVHVQGRCVSAPRGGLPCAHNILPPPHLPCQFLILACDGVWDVMNNEQVAQFLLDATSRGAEKMSDLAGDLIDHCLELGSRDNMSAVVIAFAAAPKPEP